MKMMTMMIIIILVIVIIIPTIIAVIIVIITTIIKKEKEKKMHSIVQTNFFLSNGVSPSLGYPTILSILLLICFVQFHINK